MIFSFLFFGLVDFKAGDDEFCQNNLYKMFGYFSLIGLLKLHTLTSDYYMALKTIECIDLDVNKQVRFLLRYSKKIFVFDKRKYLSFQGRILSSFPLHRSNELSRRILLHNDEKL